MAEAFARHLSGETVQSYSSGSKPSGVVNPKVIKAMSELGIDMTNHKSESLDKMPSWEWDWVITMGCGDSCPHVPAKNRADWKITDPKSLPPEQFNKVRDEIKEKVEELISQINSSTQS